MGPIRTHKHSQQASTSKQTQHQRKSNTKQTNSDPNALPGVQKIKASIRQARRLLAKDKLDADVRVQTERKLKSLEADLAKAEENRKEKTLATRYHKVKFFGLCIFTRQSRYPSDQSLTERQKVTRKIKQTIRELSEADGSSRERLKSELLSLRVDLNYILHYPKTKKYISLFPPEARHGQEQPKAAPSATTDAEREEIRHWIRQQMEKGDLPAEPEAISHPEDESSKKVKPKLDWDKDKQKKSPTHQMDKDDDSGLEDKDDFFEDANEDEDS
ncbi:18S rRNA maturation protein [Marasmius tenuissimus]|uniref:rRNA-processing protein EFG1 n=1 Tax=Marasmius tenuissimus TaxID=585030 RepID=A0ABR3AGA5_9AGAR